MAAGQEENTLLRFRSATTHTLLTTTQPFSIPGTCMYRNQDVYENFPDSIDEFAVEKHHGYADKLLA